jgi:hypothetical protein
MEKERILFWEGDYKSDGKHYFGAIIEDIEKVFDAVSTFEFNFMVWPKISGNKADELEVLEEMKDMDEYELREALTELVGSEGEFADGGQNEVYEVCDCLAFDLREKCFFNLNEVETFKAYGYNKGGNWTVTYLNDNTDTEYEFEILDTYNLDYQEKGQNSTDFTYGGMGEHSKLHKVKEDDKEYLLMHNWSQWQGSELDGGYLLTKEEALEELAEHPEFEEIREWLNK